MVLTSALVLLGSSLAAAAEGSALFDYENNSLNDGNIEAFLDENLPKQPAQVRRSVVDYISTFRFASVDVTSDPVDYDFKGQDGCKVFPGDEQWPSKWLWTGLKAVTMGNLLQADPMASVCYPNGTDSLDEVACEEVTENWNIARFISDHPIEVMSPDSVGLTCQPPELMDTSGCTQGGYPTYTVDVSNVFQIQMAVNFARNTGIRFVIKNTGHDFLGKSSGAGSLSVWMHGMKDMAYLEEYEDPTYSGPAIKAGAGVQGFELYEFGYEHNSIGLGGLCVTVGILGGWFQGGGHSPLSPLFGMGADQVLSLEVVTADGRFVTANRETNPELFWALCGGGAGTYGVVTSVTVKAYPNVPATAATWTFSTDDVTPDQFKESVRSWLSYFPRYADMGLYSYLNVVPTPSGGNAFIMNPLIAPNKTLSQTQAIIQPWLDEMTALNVTVTPDWTYHSEWYAVTQTALTNGSANNYGGITGNRLFPRSNFEDPSSFTATFDAIWSAIEAGNVMLPYNIAPGYAPGSTSDNAVNPAWREAIAYIIVGGSVDPSLPPAERMAAHLNFTHGPMQALRDVSPGAGSYGNEGDKLEPNFQWAYYGSFYPRLLELKKRLDPWNLFYAATAVGAEFLEVRGSEGTVDENGRLCVNVEPVLFVAEG